MIGIMFGSLLVAPWYISLFAGIVLLIKYEANFIVTIFALIFDLVFRSSEFSYISMPATLLTLLVIVLISLAKKRLWPVIN